VDAALTTTTLLTHSRCIQQDDSHDWSTESAAMREVYSNAAFCIAATAAENGKMGLFFNRDVEVMAPVRIELSRATDVHNEAALNQLCGSYWLSFEMHNRNDSIEAAALNQRAWVAQERFLSRRTIHFARDILFWECQRSFTSETHPNGHADVLEDTRGGRALKTWCASYERRRVANGDSSVEKHTKLQDIDTFYSKWRQFLNFYTSCKLTEGADVLVALDGVSREIAATLQDEMIAGLWKGRLLSELCWRTSDRKPCRPPFRTAPSWSWVSRTNSITTHYDNDSWSSTAKVEQAYVNLSPSGTFKRASINLRCRLIPTDPECFWHEYRPWSKHTTKLSQVSVTASPDDTEYWNIAGPAQEIGVFVILLRSRLWLLDSGLNMSEATGIIIRPAHDHPLGCYERIGHCRLTFIIPELESKTIPEIVQECSELQTVELV
jgi:hypothetical protein